MTLQQIKTWLCIFVMSSLLLGFHVMGGLLVLVALGAVLVLPFFWRELKAAHRGQSEELWVLNNHVQRRVRSAQDAEPTLWESTFNVLAFIAGVALILAALLTGIGTDVDIRGHLPRFEMLLPEKMNDER